MNLILKLNQFILVLIFTMVLFQSCQRNMQNQPYLRPLRESRFFENGLSERPLVPGVVPREPYKTQPTQLGQPDLDMASLKRGQERYVIYCSVCHGQTGIGDGQIVLRGFKRPPSFHEERLREAEAAYFYQVIVNGYGVMMSYASRVGERDRWAIAHYIKALQLSQNLSIEALNPEQREKLQQHLQGLELDLKAREKVNQQKSEGRRTLKGRSVMEPKKGNVRGDNNR